MNSNLIRIGTILYALVVGYFGVMHIMNAAMMSGAVPSYVPESLRTIAVYVSGGGMVLAAIAFLVNRYVRLAGILLCLLLLVFALTIHLKSYMGGDQMAMGQFLKDTGLAAAALIVAGTARN